MTVRRRAARAQAPHNYQILSGPLRMTGLPDVAEKEAFKRQGEQLREDMAYLDDWYAQPETRFGLPHLQWSFNKDGEEIPGMVSARDKRFDFNTTDERRIGRTDGVIDNGVRRPDQSRHWDERRRTYTIGPIKPAKESDFA